MTSIDEVSKLLEKCGIREKVIILLMVSTGIRVGAIPGIRISDLRKSH